MGGAALPGIPDGQWLGRQGISAPRCGLAYFGSAPRLRGYARETFVSEKFQAMVVLGITNSRMKDYYDLWILSNSFDFDQERLAQAISATFARRGASIPDEVPDTLTPAFAEDAMKQQQWQAFKRDLATETGIDAPFLYVLPR